MPLPFFLDPEDPFLPPDAAEADVVARVALALLFESGGLSLFLHKLPKTSSEQRLMTLLGVSAPPSGENAAAHRRQQLAQRLAELGPFDGRYGTRLEANLGYLAERVGLSDLERRILGFVILVTIHRCLAKLSGMAFGDLDRLGTVRVCAGLFGEPEGQVSAAFARQGVLARSGLLQLEPGPRKPLYDKFTLLDGLADALSANIADVAALIDQVTPLAPPARLRLADFPHRRAEIALARRLLAGSRAGLNLLFYGPPGTGKTELARALAAALNCALHTVPSADDQGDPITGLQRLRRYRLAQSVLAQQAATLILFDEVEDVFPHQGRVAQGQAERNKGWINEALESNRLPTIWVSNSLAGFDEAYLRRFAQVIEVGVPPLAVRERLVQTHTRHLPVSRAFRRRVAQHPDLSPALLRQAADNPAVVDQRCAETAEATLEILLNSTLKAMGHEALPRQRAGAPLRYRRECLNADQDLQALEHGLRRTPRGRICCYGPPGTGKSAYGVHLAETLQRPLFIKRASDLLSPYVGETEQRLAGLFRRADTEGAVLLLDEADSFLRDRRMIQSSWEATQINEMLTQIEAFDGLFIASTNLLETLDAAALRRFDLKIRFDYLRPDQAWTLFRATLRQGGGRLTQPTLWQTRLARLEHLTPGDFAGLARRQRLVATPWTPQTLFDALTAEIHLSQRATGRSIGFAADL
ncbi:AAA family ATPase [Thioalkalicoccus limnaeus]|uniref:AAA family ATPase n=1 Tax=Thioalkalicoccus limnaeus TaxID=120681 RepID=A0ABV4B9W2_9GAMM